MRRSRAIMARQELVRLLHSLDLDKYPNRPRSPARPEADDMANDDSLFPDDINQVPPGWDDRADAQVDAAQNFDEPGGLREQDEIQGRNRVAEHFPQA